MAVAISCTRRSTAPRPWAASPTRSGGSTLADEHDTPCPHCGEHGHELLKWSLWGGWFTRFTGWRYCPWCDKTHHPEPGSPAAMSWLVLPVLGLPFVVFGLGTFFCCFLGALA